MGGVPKYSSKCVHETFAVDYTGDDGRFTRPAPIGTSVSV